MCLAIHTTNISQFAATFNDARNQEIHRSSSRAIVVIKNLLKYTNLVEGCKSIADICTLGAPIRLIDKSMGSSSRQ